MNIPLINREEVRRLLPMSECIQAVEQSLAALSSGNAVMPQRQVMPLPLEEGEDGKLKGVLAMMPGYIGTPESFGVKVITVFPDNHAKGLDSHQGFVLLFSAEDGTPQAIIDAAEITAIRTAAASALATRLLARKDASDLVLLGSGVQAKTHLEAMMEVRKIKKVRVWNPLPGEAAKFAQEMGEKTGLEIKAQAGTRPSVAGADIICTITPAKEVVLRGADLEPGMHVNAVGACQPYERELDGAAMAKARLFVDQKAAAMAEAGDLLLAIKEGTCGLEQVVGELGELVLGKVEGRRNEEDITLFDSLGLAVEDLAAAMVVYGRR